MLTPVPPCVLRTDTKLTFKVWAMDPTFICRPLADFSQNETTAWLQQNFAGSLKETYDGTMDGTALLAFAESKDALSGNSALLDLVPLSQLPRLVSAVRQSAGKDPLQHACMRVYVCMCMYAYDMYRSRPFAWPRPTLTCRCRPPWIPAGRLGLWSMRRVCSD